MNDLSSFNIRSGVSLRKRYRAVLEQKRAKYRCDICGKEAVKREGTAIWKCRYCGATFAGGAYTLKTAAGEMASRAINRSRGE